MPYYRHDCFNPHCCRYCGSDMDLKIDVYAFRNKTEHANMIIRKSDEGYDYLTMPVEVYRQVVAEDKQEAEYSAHYNMLRVALAIYDKFQAELALDHDRGLTARSETCEKPKLDSTIS